MREGERFIKSIMSHNHYISCYGSFVFKTKDYIYIIVILIINILESVVVGIENRSH